MDPNKISIIECFTALQGEGINLGVPYSFIRVGGCPLRCNFCDTTYSFVPQPNSIKNVDDVIRWALDQGIEWVSITGGEPLIYVPQLRKIIHDLRDQCFKTHVETSGRYYDVISHYMSHIWSPDVKTPCTGEQDDVWLTWIDKMRPQDQVKCLIASEADLDYAHKVNQRLETTGCPLILQPFNQLVDESKFSIENNLFSWKTDQLLLQTKRLADVILNDKKRRWNNIRITPQLHVLMHGNKQGV